MSISSISPRTGARLRGGHPLGKIGTVREPKSISPDAVTVRIQQACEMLNIGQTKCNELIRTGALESFLLGKTRLITVRSIHALAHGKAA